MQESRGCSLSWPWSYYFGCTWLPEHYSGCVVRVFSVEKTFILVDLCTVVDCPPSRGWAPSNQLKSWIEQRLTSKSKKEFSSFIAFRLAPQHQLFNLTTQPVDFELVSKFLKINLLSIYIHPIGSVCREDPNTSRNLCKEPIREITGRVYAVSF